MVRTSKLATAISFALTSIGVCGGEVKREAHRDIIQPVHEYSHLAETVRRDAAGALVLNGFVNYTHIGTDFGFLGPAAAQLAPEAGGVRADLGTEATAWAGAWHSLNGLARENQSLDFSAPYPALIRPEFQPRVVGIHAVASGRGRLKLELIPAAAQSQNGVPVTAVWSEIFELPPDGEPGVFTASLDSSTVRSAQFLNWVAEPGSNLLVDSVSLRLEMPDISFPERVFLVSYAKLARCYSEQTGFVRDRAHIGAESLNNVAATGMFALATVAAHRAGMVEEKAARAVVARISRALDALPRKHGLLPHFVAQIDGAWVPLPEAEYSTIDTALTLIAARIAANAIGDTEAAAKALELLRHVDAHQLRDAAGYVIHGVHPDGRLIPHVWKDWGGETALVLMMQRIAAGSTLAPMMEETGRSHRGIGFITELPALFFPQFNTNARARAGDVDWRANREQRLAEQKRYFATHAPQSVAAQLGLYGLSAGEGEHGIGYLASGVEDPGRTLIYPHYILMSALVAPSTAAVYDLLETMESRGWLTAWGLVENIHVDGKASVPMISALNASFESLASYHLLMAHRGDHNDLYATAAEDPVFQDALQAVFE